MAGVLAAAGAVRGEGAEARSYARSVARYDVPEVMLVDRAGEEVSIRGLLGHDGPVVLQFVFTTCPAVCPLLTAPLAALPGRLGGEAARLLRVSISIDPEHDRPERLDEWARRFEAHTRAGASPSEGAWRFLTGERAAIERVRRAFEAGGADKSDHRPLTFVRGAPGGPWVRLEGLPGPDELAAEVRAAIDRSVRAAGWAPALEAGRRIYEDGVLPSGEPLTATALGTAPLSGAAAACARCHRPSGFGDSEGGLYVPAITAPALAAPRTSESVSRGELLAPLYQERHTAAGRARLRSLAPRPAYDRAALATALRHGRDPAGRELDAAMPRYRLEAEDLAPLAAYLADLGATADPGVEPDAIHLATVLTPGAETGAREAVLAVIEAYVRHHNADLEGYLAHPGHSPWHRDEVAASLRPWRLHVWELAGPPETWTAQLRESYRRRPVFAVVGGLSGLGAVAGEPWQPVHAFCEVEGVPCLFPLTDLPGTAPAPRWTVYLSGGVAGEARALGAHLAAWAAGASECSGGLRLVQVHRGGEPGRLAAAALRGALGRDFGGAPASTVEDRELPASGAIGELSLGAAPAGTCAAWVLWLGGDDLAALAPGQRRLLAASTRVYLSGTLAGAAAVEPEARLAAELGERLRIAWPFALPGAADPRAYRVRAWMRSRGIELGAGGLERLQLATHFALAVTDHALRHLVTRYSRRYLLERVEHEAERSLDPGLFPHLSLGPGQRVASKGCYVARPDRTAAGGLAADGGWIVP